MEQQRTEAPGRLGPFGRGRGWVGRRAWPWARRRWWLIAVVVLAAAGLVAGAVVVLAPRRRPPTLAEGARVSAAYLRDWQARDWQAMAAAVDRPPTDFAARHQSFLTALAATAATYVPGPTIAGVGGPGTSFSAHLELAGLGAWDYQGRIPLAIVHGRWMVEWSPAVIEPDLGGGAAVTRRRTLPPRGDVVAADGTPLSRVSGVTGLVGLVAPAKAPSGLVLPGDMVGQSGLQAAYNAQLMGQPSGDVMVGSRSVHHFPGAPGASVTTTIRPSAEADAERVMRPLAKMGALVALDASTGDVLALVSHPDGGYQRALLGTYPAGSTFKVITATAALSAGLTASSPVSCPPTITVDGRTFGNAEHEQYGTIPFETAFAKSCNTAFINVAKTLSDDQLMAAATALGIGTGWAFPLPHFTGQLPRPAGPVEHVSDAIGQGRVEVSPIGMAAVAAAVDSGAFHAPRLVAAPGTAGGAGGPAGSVVGSVAPTLRELMRAVVTSGTGTAANVPGDPVFGKTGTAEFGTSNPPQTHAWFIGYRDNVAFAVIVEDGGFGGDVAAPLAARFLNGLG